jgi:alkaline phosphatase
MKLINWPFCLILIFTSLFFCSCNGGGAGNAPPVSDAGEDRVVTLNISSVILDGSDSNDAEGEELVYEWSLVSKPSLSSASLANQLSANPTLKFDVEGLYSISLTVSDGRNDSVADLVDVTVVAGVKNIILLIGDGMGFEQVKAAGLYAGGKAGTMVFEKFPFLGSASNLNASGGVVDSASAATSMATGIKVDNGVISVAIPGDGSSLQTILERFKELGGSTGLVTTSIISDATPAAFAAHEPSRSNHTEIISDFLIGTHPEVLMGGAPSIDPLTAETAGYTVVQNSSSLALLDKESGVELWGQFGETSLPYEFDGLGVFPHLSESAAAALAVLDNDPDGFFLMVEGGRIDHAGHINDIQRNVFETIEFANSVQVAKDWAAGRVDTLIIVTADHETGGLEVVANNGAGQFPGVNWTTTNHTAQRIPVYAWGVNAHFLEGEIDNTEIYNFMKGAVQ